MGLIGTAYLSHPRTVTTSGVQEVQASSTSPIIIKILKDLRSCESTGKDEAINPKDLDGTASYGRYSFKPGTLLEWGKKYHILPDIEPVEIMNVIMDGELQERILIPELDKNWQNESWWANQFPNCGAKYRFWEYKDEI